MSTCDNFHAQSLAHPVCVHCGHDKATHTKAKDWSQVPWTRFEQCAIPDDVLNRADQPTAIFRNSRYQVTVYEREADAEAGIPRHLHLSLKVHDRSAWHDWRDLQRIKNEIAGRDCEAIELFPAEDRLVDSANQYHLFVLEPGARFPFGFRERLVAEGTWEQSQQRPWPEGERPKDALDAAGMSAAVQRAMARR